MKNNQNNLYRKIICPVCNGAGELGWDECYKCKGEKYVFEKVEEVKQLSDEDEELADAW